MAEHGAGRQPRRRARELALRALYAWLAAGGGEARNLLDQAHGWTEQEEADADYLALLVRGVTMDAAGLHALLEPLLDRPVAQLSPVEHAIVLLAALELRDHLETPYRVVINEAVELAKSYGGTDGHRFVNGVLDRLAGTLRPTETAARGQAG